MKRRMYCLGSRALGEPWPRTSSLGHLDDVVTCPATLEPCRQLSTHVGAGYAVTYAAVLCRGSTREGQVSGVPTVPFCLHMEAGRR